MLALLCLQLFLTLFLRIDPKLAKLSSKKLCEILPLIRYNTIDYWLKMFYLEHIYIGFDMKSNKYSCSGPPAFESESCRLVFC